MIFGEGGEDLDTPTHVISTSKGGMMIRIRVSGTGCEEKRIIITAMSAGRGAARKGPIVMSSIITRKPVTRIGKGQIAVYSDEGGPVMSEETTARTGGRSAGMGIEMIRWVILFKTSREGLEYLLLLKNASEG